MVCMAWTLAFDFAPACPKAAFFGNSQCETKTSASGAESRAKMARMHIDRLWKYDAALGSRLPHGTRHEIYARKPLDTAGQNNFNIYEAEIFQCLRVSRGLFWRWSPYTVQETTLYVHLTSFFGNFVGQL